VIFAHRDMIGSAPRTAARFLPRLVQDIAFMKANKDFGGGGGVEEIEVKPAMPRDSHDARSEASSSTAPGAPAPSM